MLADGSAEFFHFLGVHSSIWSSVFGPRRSLAALCCCCLLDACFWDVREGPGFRRRQDEGKDRSRIFVCLPLFHYFFLCEKALRLLNRIWARSRNYLWSECWNSPIVVKWLVCLFLHERMLSNPKNDSSWLFSFPKLVWASTNLPKKKRAPNMIFRIWSSRPIRSQSKLILGKHKKFMIQSFLFFCTSKHFSIELLGRDTQDQRLPTIQLGPYF